MQEIPDLRFPCTGAAFFVIFHSTKVKIKEGGVYMKKKSKIVLSILLAAGILAGCGGNAASPEKKPESVPAKTEESVKEEAVSKEAEPEENVRCEEIWFHNGEKKIFAQMYLPEEESDKYPAIVISHGFNGSYTDNIDRAKLFASKGYAAVVFDFCGGGRSSKSDGSMVEMSVLTEAQDLNAIIDEMLAMDNIDAENFFLLGASQGGFISSYVAAQRPDDIKALMLLFPAYALQDDCWARHGSIENIPETESFMNNTLGAIYSRDAMSFDIYDVIGDYKGDVMIHHGDKDEVVALSYSEKAAEVYEHAELKVIKGAGHGFHGKHLTESNESLVAFLEAHTN